MRKGLELNPLQSAVEKHVSHALVIGRDKEAYVKLLKQAGVSYHIAGTIEKAVVMAGQDKSKLPVLLSPAAASQDQFNNYAERGKAFASAIQQLSEGAT